jgi:hypothetical protein
MSCWNRLDIFMCLFQEHKKKVIPYWTLAIKAIPADGENK